MKILTALLLIILTQTASAKSFTQTSLDKNGFVNCISVENKTYFFIWDQFIQTKTKKITYIEKDDYIKVAQHKVNGCDDVNYLHEISNELLHEIDEIKDILPTNVLQSLNQVSEGAHLFHPEATPELYILNHSNIFKKDSAEVLTNLRYEVGNLFAEQIMQTWTSQLYSVKTTCSELIGTCDFYLCQEKQNPCGLDGYNLSYGYKYCSGSKFKLYDQMKTSAGKKWVVDVFTCLQQKSFENSLYLSSENMCVDLKEKAFSSHPNCYVQAGFCDLPLFEKEKIFNLIKKEIFSKETITQGIQLIKECKKIK